MIARASAVFPAPRSPSSVTTSPGRTHVASAAPIPVVAASSGAKRESLFPGILGEGGIGRNDHGDARAARLAAFDQHRAAMQIDEGLDDGKPQPRTALA